MQSSGDNSEHVLYENDDQDAFGNDENIQQTPPGSLEDNCRAGDQDEIIVLNDPVDSQSNSQAVPEKRKETEKYEEKPASPLDASEEASLKKESKDNNETGTEAAWHLDGSLPVGCTLYVRNLPTYFQSDHVRSYFNRHGEVIDCRIVINPVTKESRGFGFVTYSTVEIADQAMNQMDHTEIEGRVLRVEKARRNKPHDPTPGEYKGSTGASIKYDNRGRLKPGYVPYWDLPPSRSSYKLRNVRNFRPSDGSPRPLRGRDERMSYQPVRSPRYERESPYRRYDERFYFPHQPVRTKTARYYYNDDISHRRPSPPYSVSNDHYRGPIVKTRSRSRIRGANDQTFPSGGAPHKINYEAQRYRQSPANYYGQRDRLKHPPSPSHPLRIHKPFLMHREKEIGRQHQFPLHEDRLHSHAPRHM